MTSLKDVCRKSCFLIFTHRDFCEILDPGRIWGTDSTAYQATALFGLVIAMVRFLDLFFLKVWFCGARGQGKLENENPCVAGMYCVLICQAYML